MRVYISGKIGEEVLSKATREKFARAEKMLQSRGFETFNPTTSGFGRLAESKAKLEGTTFYEEIMMLDLQQVKACDAIYMLPDFLDSPGAKAEHALAIAMKKQVYYDEELFRDGTLRAKSYQENRLPEINNETANPQGEE